MQIRKKNIHRIVIKNMQQNRTTDFFFLLSNRTSMTCLFLTVYNACSNLFISYFTRSSSIFYP